MATSSPSSLTYNTCPLLDFYLVTGATAAETFKTGTQTAPVKLPYTASTNCFISIAIPVVESPTDPSISLAATNFISPDGALAATLYIAWYPTGTITPAPNGTVNIINMITANAAPSAVVAANGVSAVEAYPTQPVAAQTAQLTNTFTAYNTMTNATACAPMDYYIATSTVAPLPVYIKLFTSTTRCIISMPIDATILTTANALYTFAGSWATANAGPTLYPVAAGTFSAMANPLAITAAGVVFPIVLNPTTSILSLVVPQFQYNSTTTLYAPWFTPEVNLTFMMTGATNASAYCNFSWLPNTVAPAVVNNALNYYNSTCNTLYANNLLN
jgi:hypothetical protein